MQKFVIIVNTAGYFFLVLILLGLALYNYLLFHTAVEFFAIVVGLMIYSFGVRTFKYSGNFFLLFIGYSYLFISVIDFLHTMTFKGVSVLQVVQTNTATQLWIAGRGLEAFTMFIAPTFYCRSLSSRKLFWGYFTVTCLLIASIMWFDFFPVCYIEGKGLTTFKVASEWVISLALLGAFLRMRGQKERMSSHFYKTITTAITLTVFSELAFTLYTDAYSFLNFTGHILKLASYYLIYHGLVVRGIEAPYEEILKAYDSTLVGWAKALELRDHETEGHSQRVCELAEQTARAIGMDEKDCLNVRRGALLHDVGKIGIPDSILLKEGPLTEEEWEVIRMHPQYAYELLSGIPFLRSALAIPYFHHEEWDGSGYPKGLKGDKIPFEARLFALIDVWDALPSDRPYRSGWTEEKVRDYIKKEGGKNFDPRLTDMFLKLISQEGNRNKNNSPNTNS